VEWLISKPFVHAMLFMSRLFVVLVCFEGFPGNLFRELR
jgi:hypothetical protein